MVGRDTTNRNAALSPRRVPEAIEVSGRGAVFLAIGISPAVAGEVARAQQVLGGLGPPGLFRFADPDQSHVTLRFLGQRSPEEQQRIAVAAATTATRSAPFELVFGGLGVFPDQRRPHTLWLGLKRGRSDVVALAARLTEALEREGFPPESRSFAPHLTLARIRQRPPPATLTRMLGPEVDGTAALRVEDFFLMESRAAGGRVRYLPLRTFRLENTCTPSE
jgi:2'-5' RNA ligase